MATDKHTKPFTEAEIQAKLAKLKARGNGKTAQQNLPVA